MTIEAVATHSLKARAGSIGKFVLLGLAAFFTLAPVVWTLITALTVTDAETGDTQVGLGAFADVFAQIPVWLYTWNSALVTLLIAVCQMLTAAMAGYVFARFEFRSKKWLFGLILATMMVPMQVTIVPVFMLVRGMGLADTLLALIVPMIPTAFGTFLMRQYFMQMPRELGEAARIDGASQWGVFFHVYARMAAPAISTLAILNFSGFWAEFYRPLIFLQSQSNFTLPLGLVGLQGNLGTGSISVVLAGVVIAMIPSVLLFIFAQRYFIAGVTAGSSR